LKSIFKGTIEAYKSAGFLGATDGFPPKLYGV